MACKTCSNQAMEIAMQQTGGDLSKLPRMTMRIESRRSWFKKAIIGSLSLLGLTTIAQRAFADDPVVWVNCCDGTGHTGTGDCDGSIHCYLTTVGYNGQNHPANICTFLYASCYYVQCPNSIQKSHITCCQQFGDPDQTAPDTYKYTVLLCFDTDAPCVGDFVGSYTLHPDTGSVGTGGGP
jgi:hypothetical protein